ncbi:hypothetical protein, partial [Lactococcus petauri]|uniref:hypothetical protein n=1 Tax=Lactococcus petauri TaxID=1940789 RepID=UPI002550BEBA
KKPMSSGTIIFYQTQFVLSRINCDFSPFFYTRSENPAVVTFNHYKKTDTIVSGFLFFYLLPSR